MLFLTVMICMKMVASKNQILMLLLNLELLALLSLFILILVYQIFSSPMLLFSFLVLIVCEASVGLSLLINLTRDWGSESLIK